MPSTMNPIVPAAAAFQYLMKSIFVSCRMRSMDRPLDAQRLGAARAVEPQEIESPHHEDRRDEGCEDAGDQRHGEALHRASAVLIEHGGGEDGRYVGVDDCRH